MTIIYRMSYAGYNKVKPDYINNENCLLNTLKIFPVEQHKWYIIADGMDENDPIFSKIPTFPYIVFDYVNKGSGAETFNLALDIALEQDEDEIVYFIENDYIHLPMSYEAIMDMITLKADYATLYLHPDKFIPPKFGGNPLVHEDGGYTTKIWRGVYGLYHWVDSTTMTFASKVKTLREDEKIIRRNISGTYPKDYNMFLELRAKRRVLLCPVNTYSTHGESQYLSPITGFRKDQLENKWKNILFS